MYSQYGEDEQVLAIVGERPNGRVLEIGAWDPVQFSNSRAFIERGWNAVLVDFSPTPVRKLVGEYGRNERVQIIQAAIHPCDSGLMRFEITDDAVSTSDPATQQKWARDGGYFGGLWVPQIPLAALLGRIGADFDFISIDAEGISIELAIALLRDCVVRPLALCVEHDNRQVELMQVAQICGYSCYHMNGTNMILRRGQ